MNQICFTIPGTPVPWQRAGRNGKRSYDTPRNLNAKAAFAWEAKVAMGNTQPFKGPVRLKLQFVFKWPSSYTQTRRRACYGNMRDTKPDIDNLCKTVMDGLNGIAWGDDAQVSELITSKFFTESEERTQVVVEPLWEQPE